MSDTDFGSFDASLLDTGMSAFGQRLVELEASFAEIRADFRSLVSSVDRSLGQIDRNLTKLQIVALKREEGSYDRG